MDLEQVNSDYVKLKSDLEYKKRIVSICGDELGRREDDVTIAKGKLIEAKRSGDIVEQQKAEKELQDAKVQVKMIKQSLEDWNKQVQELQEKINNRIKEVSEEPELKQYLNEVMEKQYERKITRLNKEKSLAEAKKEGQDNLRQLVSEHPALMNNLRGVMSANMQIKDLKEELEKITIRIGANVTYSDPTKAQEINDKISKAQEKIGTNKKSLMDFIDKNGIKVSESDIDEALPYKPLMNSDGTINVDATLNKNIKGLKRKIKGIDKNIKNYEIALDNIKKDKQLAAQQMDPAQQIDSDVDLSQGEKLKWYQFRKRFKNWNERRKQKKLEAPAKQVVPKPIQPATLKQQGTGTNPFAESLKYRSGERDANGNLKDDGIVWDILNKQNDDNLRIANLQRKFEMAQDDEGKQQDDGKEKDR